MTSHWTREAVARIASSPIPAAPLIDLSCVMPVLSGFDLWDYWPVQELDGRTADIAGGALQMLLCAPVLDDPDTRHGIARIRLMHQTASGWQDLGNLLPDGFSPGSREWSGSAVVDEGQTCVPLYFTVAGRRGEGGFSVVQRPLVGQGPPETMGGGAPFGPLGRPL